MPHLRKKGGERKDKKNERMRESVTERKLSAGPKRPSTDQQDIQTFKPGSEGDRSAPINLPHGKDRNK